MYIWILGLKSAADAALDGRRSDNLRAEKSRLAPVYRHAARAPHGQENGVIDKMLFPYNIVFIENG
ncbi:hypothetical protein [Massilia antarctica]|uniref:hypothetical protein n=1 Tax=Massilia antarctica TaxID=2765360 RepID=UPI0006BB718D|nr:hypothetical protein [Massilia sp. H27-R4]MCY0911422.1 hypothetical protein [Massilia sp. H27-R4]CUI04975.1 hypothetical protein BN2497_4727 [Janthinobacterium sp. CG23_2]CUU28761.1 hypothetical protein BN3177_4727 [Janthinobacterium sp. CG23_2]